MDIHVSGGFCLLLTLLLFLDEENIVPWGLFACFLHELGHCAAIRLFGGELASLRLSVVGAEILPKRSHLFSYREELCIAAAGPAASLLAAVLSALAARWGLFGTERMLLFSGLNLAAGFFNLLPLGPLDGGRMLRILLMRSHNPWELNHIYQRMTILLSAGLLGAGAIHWMRNGGNPTLFLSALWLFSTARSLSE